MPSENIPDNIGLALSAISTALLIIYKTPSLMQLLNRCAKNVMCIPTMLKIVHLKLKQDVSVVQEIEKQDNQTVMYKLGLPDELVKCLQELAPGEDGTINEEVALAWIKVINKIIQNKNEKLQPLEMKKP